MSQTKAKSLIESILNVGSGLIISFLVMQFVICPLYGMELPARSNLSITLIFTVISITRTYIWRRYFEKT